ncbi:hypothetical protein EYF80_018993 [Liparis tanakae]|uniref:Uncharacterized protein n=1 Tax=Liparis tanakae TaxID=230148 RepID=A0A4Z2HYU4_9TELE|nr:hypothetical protein EYF80_018993 [Liparis tanakae]
MFNPLAKRPGGGEGGPVGGAGCETIPSSDGEPRGQREQGNPQNKPPPVKASPPCCQGTAIEEDEQTRERCKKKLNLALKHHCHTFIVLQI